MSKLVNEMSEIKMSQLKRHQERIKELNGSTMKKVFGIVQNNTNYTIDWVLE